MDKNLQYVITADASGFVAGWQQMAQAMAAVQAMMAQLDGGAAASAATTGTLIQRSQQYTQAVTAQATAQRDFLQTLRERVETQGLSPDDLLRYRAAQHGVSASADVLINKLAEARAAAEAKAAADAAAAVRARDHEQAVRQQAQAQAQYLAMLRERVETQGMDPAALLRYRAQQLGVGEQAEQLIGKLNAQGRAGAAAGAQMQNAMRMLPMQMTDVVTSLASGMPLWMVLIQQGGQIKDSFGGIGPMMQGLGTYIRGIGAAIVSNPIAAALVAITVASVGAAVAFVQGQRDSDRLAEALRNTGNAAGLTEARFNGLVRAAADANGVGMGAARAAAQAAVASGEFGAASISSAIQAITAYSRATGKSAEEAAGHFKGITRNAAQWAEEQNRSLHFLTLGTYNHIKSLQDQGRAQEAAAVAMQAMTRHLAEQPQHLGWIERAARSAGNAMSNFWDSAKGIGRAETVGDQLDTIGDKLAALEKRKPQMGGWMGQRATADWEREKAALTERQGMLQEQQRTEQRAAAMKAEAAERNAKAIEAKKHVEQVREQTATPAERRADELSKYRRAADAARAGGEVITPEQQRKDEAAIAAKYRDPKPAGGGEKSRMGAFEEMLAGERTLATERDALHGMSQRSELQFWERIARAEKMTSGDRTSVQKKMADLRTSILRTSAQDQQAIDQARAQSAQQAELQEVDQRMEAARAMQQAGRASQVETLQREIEFEGERLEIKRRHLQAQIGDMMMGADPARDAVKIAQLNAQVQGLEQQHAARITQIRSTIAVTQARVSSELQDSQLRRWEESELSKIAVAEEHARQQLAQGEIKQSRLLQLEEQFEQRRQQIRMSALSSQIDAIDPANDPVKFQEMKAKIEQLEMQHQQRMAQIRGQAATVQAKESGQIWDDLGKRTSGLWDKGVNAMINGTLTWRNAEKAIAAEAGQWFLASVIKPRITAWILGETTKTSATVAGTTARTTAEATGAATSTAVTGSAAVTNIMSSAWEAMAGAWKAMVGIPYIGPALAVGAAAAAFAGVSALAGRVKSARGGYDIPAGVNPMTQLHEEEMVLPKQHANTIRALGAAMRGGAGVQSTAAAPRIEMPVMPVPQAAALPRVVPDVGVSEALGRGIPAAQGGFAAGAVQAMQQAGLGGERISAPVTYNDHSGRLDADALRRNARVLGEIWTEHVRTNRVRPA